MNTQQPEAVSRDGEALDVHSIFKTIQGEGPYAGRPAIFIRLAGCNLQCPACDTEYTQGRRDMTPPQIVLELQELTGCHTPLIVITGGEPFRQQIGMLLDYLFNCGYKVQVETNGTLTTQALDSYVYKGLSIVCSPKTALINSEVATLVTAYKYVIKHGEVDRETGLPTRALDHPCSAGRVYRPHPKFPANRIYIQPLDEGHAGRNRMNVLTAIESCQRFGYIFCLQIHKIINLP